MTIVIALSLLICLLGLVLYLLSDKPKVQAIALDCFWVGLLAFLIQWGGRLTVH